jgi:hypothetical protein
MADPSMDKQELYVAASRSREETFIYATPEIQTHREEIAPESPYPREGIPHIAEAAEHDPRSTPPTTALAWKRCRPRTWWRGRPSCVRRQNAR